ncbi:MAG: NAD-dependent epimerase/dehydratase family protein [Acidobacteriota bacterium]
MRILVTGATGFIGGHLARQLQAEHEVYALTRKSPSHPDAPALSEVRWIEQDVTAPLNRSRLPPRLDAILHLAQSEFYKQFPTQARDIFEVNTQSTLHLLEYGREAGISRFVYASSGGVYGFREEGFIETDPVNPLNFYLSSKYCAELLIANYQQFFRTVVLRLFFVYGEGQSSSMLIPRLIDSVAAGRPIVLQGQDGIRINPTYVGDAVAAFERGLTLEGSQLINVAGPEVLSLREIGEIIGRQLGCAPVFNVQPDQEPTHLVGDLAKMKTLLGGPHVTFVEGVARVCRREGVPNGSEI